MNVDDKKKIYMNTKMYSYFYISNISYFVCNNIQSNKHYIFYLSNIIIQ